MSCCGALIVGQMGKKLESIGAAPRLPHLHWTLGNTDSCSFFFFPICANSG